MRMLQHLVPKALEDGGKGGTGLQEVSKLVEHHDQAFLARLTRQGFERLIPSGKVSALGIVVEQLAVTSRQLGERAVLGTQVGHVEEVAFALAETPQQLGLTHATPAVEHDQFGLVGGVTPFQESQLARAIDEHGIPLWDKIG